MQRGRVWLVEHIYRLIWLASRALNVGCDIRHSARKSEEKKASVGHELVRDEINHTGRIRIGINVTPLLTHSGFAFVWLLNSGHMLTISDGPEAGFDGLLIWLSGRSDLLKGISYLTHLTLRLQRFCTHQRFHPQDLLTQVISWPS